MKEPREGSPSWQIMQAIKTKKLLIKAADDDIARATRRRDDALEELAEYEQAYAILTKEKDQ